MSPENGSPRNLPGPNLPGPNLPGPNLPGPNLPGPNLPGPSMPWPAAGGIRAAGTVVVRQAAAGPEVLLVHRPRYGDWSLPKGKLHKGEAHPVAAVRETLEETGYQVRLGPPIGAVRYQVADSPKEVRYWRATAAAAPGDRSGADVDASAWFAVDKALGALARASERQVALTAVELDVTVPLVVARHTAARPRKDWQAADPDRPLDERGNHDAGRLGRLLATWAPGRVVSSTSRRCIESITPYAARVAAKIELEPVLSEEEHSRRPDALAPLLDALVAELRRQLADPATAADTARTLGTVLCTHRPVLPAVADVLGVPLAPEDEEEPLPPGGCWVLHLSGDRTLAIERHTVSA